MSAEKRRNRIQSSSITTVISMSLVLFVMGLLGIVLLGGKKISDYSQEHIGFTVYIKNTAKEDETDRLQRFLKASPFAKSSEYLSKDSAAASYAREIGEDFIKSIGYNPLRNMFEVRMNASYANPDSVQWIKKQITDFSCVEEFDYKESQLDWVNKNKKIISLGLLTILAVLLLIALVLINNTIRLAIYSKRFLVKTMQLVGATGGFIRKPFLITSLQQGFISGIIAVLMIFGGVYALVKLIPDFQQITDKQLMIYLFGSVLMLGIIISGASTFFAVRK